MKIFFEVKQEYCCRIDLNQTLASQVILDWEGKREKREKGRGFMIFTNHTTPRFASPLFTFLGGYKKKFFSDISIKWLCKNDSYENLS